MGTKKILEFEKKVISLANVSKDPISNYVTDKTIAFLDTIEEATEQSSKSERISATNAEPSANVESKDAVAEQQPSAFRNWLNALFAKKIGGFLAFGPQGSGKTTLFQSADRVFRLCDDDYCCENQTTPKTLSLESKKKWTTGCFIIDGNEGKVNFNAICDTGGSKEQQKALLRYLPDSDVVVFCFSLVDLYKDSLVTLTESCEVSLADYLCAWTKVILLKIKENKKLQKKKMTFIYLATHADKSSLPPEYSEEFHNKISCQKIREYIEKFNATGVCSPVNYDFIIGSFYSAEKVRDTWDAIIKSVGKR